MTEIKLIFVDVLVGQSLGLPVEIDNNKCLYYESFKTKRTLKTLKFFIFADGSDL